MDGARLARMRWRRRGAWLWPAFVASLLADGLIGHLLPPTGETQKLLGAALLGCFLNLLGIVVLSPPFAVMLRRRRGDLPRVVARDYAGTAAIAAVTGALLLAGLLHRPSIVSHEQARHDAITRAQAFIGDRAPAEFRRHLSVVDTFAIEPGSMYRVCVPSSQGLRSYCVIVKSRLPFAQSVSFDGYEANSVFAAGAG
ncbi:MAG: hypothetical protein M3Z27_00480 [Actinomycetota bacterium]|nr:hypothetical protein [Actinomycetota bacterium]